MSNLAAVSAIVALLPPVWDGLMRDSQAHMQANFGLVQVPTHPHCTLHVAESYQLDGVIPVLQSISAETTLSLTAAGLGIFPQGDEHLIFVTVTPHPHLRALHQRFYDALPAYTQNFHSLYTPDRWIPHMTLGAVPTIHLPAAMAWLVEQKWYGEFEVAELALMVSAENTVIKHSSYPLAQPN